MIDQENIDNIRQEMLMRLAKYNKIGFKTYNEFHRYMSDDPQRWKSPDEPLHFMDLLYNTYWLPAHHFNEQECVFIGDEEYYVVYHFKDKYDHWNIMLQNVSTLKYKSISASFSFIYCGKYGWRLYEDKSYSKELTDANPIIQKYFGKQEKLVSYQDTVPYFSDIDYENDTIDEIELGENEARRYFDPRIFNYDKYGTNPCSPPTIKGKIIDSFRYSQPHPIKLDLSVDNRFFFVYNKL